MRVNTIRIALFAIVAAWLCAAVAVAASPVVTPMAATPSPTPAPTPTPLPVYEDTLTTMQEASPTSMVAPEPMQVKLTIFNEATEPIGDIRICRDNGSLIADVGVLSATGIDNYPFTEMITPTDTQLDEGQLVYLIRYTLGAGKPGAKEGQQDLVVPLTKLPAEPGVEFTRSIPVDCAKQGEEATIAYRVRNTGNVALTNIVVTDGKQGEVGTLDRLEPGARKNFIHRYEVDETFTSKPVLTYSHRATRELFEKELAGSTIYLADERLDITLEADRSTVSPGDMVTLTYSVFNRGSVSYDHLRLSDQLLGDIVTLSSELKPGKNYVFSKAIEMKSTTTFLFTLTGLSEGGTPIEAASNPLTVAVTPVLDDVALKLTAEASTVRLDGPGDVDFTLIVHNDGALDLPNVRLLELGLGEISTLAVAAPGDTVAKHRCHVEAPTKFLFMAELTDAKDGRLVVNSNAVEVTFGENGSPGNAQAPEDEALWAVAGSPYQLPDDPVSFSRMMVGVLVVIAVLGTFIASATVSRQRKKRRLRDRRLRMLRRNYRLEQQEDERQQTRPHAPVAKERSTPSSRKPGSLGKVKEVK